MKMQRAPRTWAPGLAQICAALSILLALTIIAGWHLGNDVLVRLHPTFAAVPHNTALVFGLLGLGILAGAGCRPAWTLCAIPAVVYCLLSLAQDLFGSDLGIDQMFFEHPSGGRPGRMAPVTALAFLFLGICILVSGVSRSKHLQVPFAVLISSALVALAAVVFVTCLVRLGVPRRFFFAMAPGTALALMLLGVGVLALFCRGDAVARLPRWLPAPVGVGVSMVVVVLYQALEADARRQAEQVASSGAARVDEHLRLSLQANGFRILAASKAWQETDPQLWSVEKLAQEAERQQLPGLLSLESLSPALDRVWAAPPGGFAPLLKEAAGCAKQRQEVLARAQLRNGRALSQPMNLTRGGKGIFAALPRITLGKVVAWELALLDTQAWVSGILDKQVVAGFGMTIWQGEEKLYRSPGALQCPEPNAVREASIRQGSVIWNVRIWPTPELIAAKQSTVPRVALGVGLFLALFLSLTTYLAQTAFARAKDASDAHRSLQEAHEQLRVEMEQRLRAEEQFRHSQRIEAVGRLAGSVAHDFNNLLTVIVGHSDLLRQGLPEPDPLRPAADIIAKTADQAAALTRQLLAFARKQTLAPRLIDLASVLESTEVMLRRLLGVNIQLDVVLRPGLGKILADPVQVQQVILNLAINARDAMPKGGKLAIETSQVDLDAEHAQTNPEAHAGPYVLLAVSDTGQGMDANTKAHLFEPFFTTKEPGKGTGLGLATVHGIVKQSGGHIEVESEVGRGTTFRIYFPRSATG